MTKRETQFVPAWWALHEILTTGKMLTSSKRGTLILREIDVFNVGKMAENRLGWSLGQNNGSDAATGFKHEDLDAS